MCVYVYVYVYVREGDLRRTNYSENCLGTALRLAWPFNPPIDPSDANNANDPGEMIEAAEDKVDSVSHFVWWCREENDSCLQRCSQGGLTVRVQVSDDNVAGKGSNEPCQPYGICLLDPNKDALMRQAAGCDCNATLSYSSTLQSTASTLVQMVDGHFQSETKLRLLPTSRPGRETRLQMSVQSSANTLPNTLLFPTLQHTPHRKCIQ